MPLLFIKVYDHKILSIEIRKEESILSLKKKLYEKCGISTEEQTLYYNGVFLCDNKTIMEYNITSNSETCINLIKRIRMSVKTKDGTITELEMLITSTISGLMKKIEAELNIPEEEQILMFKNRILDDVSNTLEKCGINAGSVISVVVQPIKINLFATTNDARTVQIELRPRDTVLDLKEKIGADLGLVMVNYELVLGDHILEDRATIKECNMKNNAVIMVRRYKMDVTVRTTAGTKHSCSVLRSDTIKDIRIKIEQQTGIAQIDQILIYNQALMKDGDHIEMDNGDETRIINVISQQRNIQLCVVVMDGRSSQINTHVDIKVGDLKKLIHQEFGIALEKQTLVSLGRLLPDEHLLSSFNIEDKATIYVID